MLNEALVLEFYRQALNAGALPTARPRSTESANSSERCPSHESNSSENGKEQVRDSITQNAATMAAAVAAAAAAAGPVGVLPLSATSNTTFPTLPGLPAHNPSMGAYLHMVAAAAQQYGFPMGTSGASQLPLPSLHGDAMNAFKLPTQTSPTAATNRQHPTEALDYRTNIYGRSSSSEPPVASDDDDDEDNVDDLSNTEDANNPLDLSVGPRKRCAENQSEPDSSIGQIQVKKIFKNHSPSLVSNTMPGIIGPPPSPASLTTQAPVQAPTTPLLPTMNPYLAAVAAANIFRGQFPDWNGKNDLVVDPLEKMSDIVKGPVSHQRKEKPPLRSNSSMASSVNTTLPTNNTPVPTSVPMSQSHTIATTNSNNNNSSAVLPATNEGVTKTRHNIWQSHWQNKGVASSVFCCVWCKQSFPTLEALTTHMKDSKHCGVNVPPHGNLPTTADRSAMPPAQGPPGSGPGHLRSASNKANSNAPSAAAKNAFQYRGDPPTPLPRKLVRGQNVWLGKGVEQAMQILKCMRCGESFRTLGEMAKHMQETQHYTNILSQEQTISMKSSASSAHSGENKDGQSLSSEESRTLSAVLTCKVCDKAFNSFGDLSNHMAKNNHYAEPLMQSMGGTGNRKRPPPKKREKSLPVRKLLEMKSAHQIEAEHQEMEMKLQRAVMGPGCDKTEAALFAERMRQYISSVKTSEEAAKANLTAVNNILTKNNKSPEIMEPKNGATKTSSGTSSVLSAIEQMFTNSFDTPTRQPNNLPATSPSNSSTKNTSPVASSILKRLGIDENVDYNKPLIDTSDPYFQHYRYTSSERSASECSGETHIDVQQNRKENPTPEKMQIEDTTYRTSRHEIEIKKEPDFERSAQHTEYMYGGMKSLNDNSAGIGASDSISSGGQVPKIKLEIKSERMDDDDIDNKDNIDGKCLKDQIYNIAANGSDFRNNNSNNTNSNNHNRHLHSPKNNPNNNSNMNINNHSPIATTLTRSIPTHSPTDSHRSLTPKSPASSIKSYEGGDKKYPSDSLNALSSMFDSLGNNATSANSITNINTSSHFNRLHSTTTTTITTSTSTPTTTLSSTSSVAATITMPLHNKNDLPDDLSPSNSLAALRQFCIKKEKTT